MLMNRIVIPALLLSSCTESQPDYTPIGDGLKTIGICLVCFAVVQVLGALSKPGRTLSGSAHNRHPIIMPNWTQCLQAIVLLSITGFCLVVVSYKWLLLAALIVAALIASGDSAHKQPQPFTGPWALPHQKCPRLHTHIKPNTSIPMPNHHTSSRRAEDRTRGSRQGHSKTYLSCHPRQYPRVRRHGSGLTDLTVTDLDRTATYSMNHRGQAEPATLLVPFVDLNNIAKSCGNADVIELEPAGEKAISHSFSSGRPERRTPLRIRSSRRVSTSARGVRSKHRHQRNSALLHP